MNSKDITSASSNILLIGDSGTHKTHFLGGVPGIYVFDFDRGMTINRWRSVEYDTFKDAPKGWEVTPTQTSRDGIYKWSTGWLSFIQRLNKLGEQIDKGTGPKAIGLDSLTFMSELAMNHVLSVSKTTEAGGPTQACYGAQQQYMKTVLGQLTAWPIQLIATAHIQRDTNDVTQNIEKLPLLTGKLAGLISVFFDEVYFCESNTEAGGTQKFTIKTRGTPQMRQAKSRWGVPDDTTTDYESVIKYFNVGPGGKSTPPTAPVAPPTPRPGGNKLDTISKAI